MILTRHSVKGKWAFPGGHLEHGESFTDCAERETLEETGLEVKGLKVINVTNDVFEEADKHYITLFVLCEMIDSQQKPEVSSVAVSIPSYTFEYIKMKTECRASWFCNS